MHDDLVQWFVWSALQVQMKSTEIRLDRRIPDMAFERCDSDLHSAMGGS